MNEKQIAMLKKWIDSQLSETTNQITPNDSDGAREVILQEIEDAQSLRRILEHTYNLDLKKGCKKEPEKPETKTRLGYG